MQNTARYDLQRTLLSHHFHSVQQFGFKPSRFGKAKGSTGMLVEQRGKLPCAYSISLHIAIQLFLFS